MRTALKYGTLLYLLLTCDIITSTSMKYSNLHSPPSLLINSGLIEALTQSTWKFTGKSAYQH